MARDTDPLGLANGTNVLFIDQKNPNATAAKTRAGLDPATPFASPVNLKSNDALLPGDTIYIRGGKYILDDNVHPTVSGTNGSPITVKPYPGEYVEIRWGTLIWGFMIYLPNINYWTWEDITFTGNMITEDGRLCVQNVFAGAGTGLKLHRCRLRANMHPDDIGYPNRLTGPPPAGLQNANQQKTGNLFQFQGPGLELIDCNFNAINAKSISDYVDGARYFGEGASLYQCTNALIRGCRFWGGFGHQCLRIIESEGLVIEYSDFSNPLHTCIGAGFTNSFIRHNVFRDFNTRSREAGDTGNGIQLGGVSVGNEITDNTFIGSRNVSTAISAVASAVDEATECRNNLFAGNHIFGCGMSGIHVGYTSGRPNLAATPRITGNEVTGNHIYGVALPYGDANYSYIFAPLSFNLIDPDTNDGNPVTDNVLHGGPGVDWDVVTRYGTGSDWHRWTAETLNGKSFASGNVGAAG